MGEALAEAGGAGRAFTVGAVMYLIAGLLGMAAPGAPNPLPARGPVQWNIHPAARQPGLVLFIGLIGYAGFLAFIALHASDVGIEVTGSVFTLFAVVVLTVRLVGARIPDRLGALTTTRLALGFSAVGLLVLGAWRDASGVYLGTFVMAVGQSFLVPALLVLVVDRSPDAERSHAIGSLSVGFDLAVGLGGFLVGGGGGPYRPGRRVPVLRPDRRAGSGRLGDPVRVYGRSSPSSRPARGHRRAVALVRSHQPPLPATSGGTLGTDRRGTTGAGDHGS